MIIQLDSISKMTVYELRCKCKKMKLKRYSKLRKKELIEFVKEHINKQKRDKEVEIINKEENIFCYPDILKEIYSYVDYDDTKEKRKKMIEKAEDRDKELKELFTEFFKLKGRNNQKNFLKKYNYTSRWGLKDDLMNNNTLRMSLEELETTIKDNLYRWLKVLRIKVTKKMKKKEMKELVIKNYNEIME